MLEDMKLERMVNVLKGIAHPIRLRIVMMLCSKEYTVGEMARELCVPQPQVSHHLAPLRLLGLVGADRAGGYATYSLSEPLLKELVQHLGACSGKE